MEGYESTSIIYETATKIVSRAIRKADRKPVVLKRLKVELATDELSSELTREYRIARQLNQLDGVLKPLSFDGNTLTLEDFNGEPLSNLIDRKELELTTFFRIGIKLAKTLQKIHQKNIIHLDLTASNIIVEQKSNIVKISDFGLARTTDENISANPNQIKGNLTYISPEQTGKIKQPIDHRSDLYSLGVVFYEMLNGKPPFTVNDPLELIHGHLAKNPKPIDNCPKIVDDIILHLLAKNINDRYQTAEELARDLETCLLQWIWHKKIDTFPIAQSSITTSFKTTAKLYGRKLPLEKMKVAYQRSIDGNLEFLTVAGSSGVGKSHLVREFGKENAEGYFITGKADRLQQNVPYAIFIEAFRELMRQILTQSDAEVETWKDRFLKQLGKNAQLLVELSPELTSIIGTQPQPPKLSPEATKNRFNFAIQNFIKALCLADRPPVIFLDDLQWADDASLELLTSIAYNPEMKSIMFIGSYRDNEVSPEHRLSKTLEKIRTKISIEAITLKPLDKNSVKKFTAELLEHQIDEVELFTELLYDRTGGNLLFVRELLQSLYEQKILTLNLRAKIWRYSSEAVQSIGVPDNVADLVAGRIKHLSPPTLEILKIAAAIGNHFETKFLLRTLGKTFDEIQGNLTEALSNGLLLIAPDGYKFSHDRIRDASYAELSDSLKKSTHLKIGRLMLNESELDDWDSQVSTIANHMNIGIDSIAVDDEKLHLMELNLMATRNALNSVAYKSADRFIKTAIELLPEEPWQNEYELALATHSMATIVARSNANFEEMDRFANEVLKNAKSLPEKIEVYNTVISAHLARNQVQLALDLTLEALRELGVKLPKKLNTPRLLLSLLTSKFKLWFGNPIEQLLDREETSDYHHMTAMRLLAGDSSVAFYLTDPKLMMFASAKATGLAMKRGLSVHALIAFAALGFALCATMIDLDRGYQLVRTAIDLLRRFDDPSAQARILFVFHGVTEHWKVSLRKTIDPLLETQEIGMENGDLEYSVCAAIFHSDHTFLAGFELPIVDRQIEKNSEICQNLGHTTAKRTTDMFRQVAHNLMGKNPEKLKLSGEAYVEPEDLKAMAETENRFDLCRFYTHKMMLAYTFADREVALENARHSEKFSKAAVGTHFSTYHNFYSSLVNILALEKNIPRSERNWHSRKIAKNQKKMRTWAKNAAMNYRHKFLLVEAERCRVEGKILKAQKYYEEAIGLARQEHFLNDEALANELAGKFYLDRGNKFLAKSYLCEARNCYDRWGAKAKVEHLEQTYSELLDRFSASRNESNKTASLSAKKVELETVSRISLAISSEIELPNLLRKIVQLTIEYSGAEKGFLIFPQSANPQSAKPRSHELSIVAGAEVKNNKIEFLQNVPIGDAICEAIVKYVSRTTETVLLGDAVNRGKFQSERQIVVNKTRSLLSMPLVRQGRLSGILYLENNLMPNVFSPDRLELLTLISSQLAISLENSRLYGNLMEAKGELTKYSESLEAQVSEQTSEVRSLLRIMAHDISNQLGVISGYVELQKESGVFNQASTETTFDRITEAARRTSAIIDSVKRMRQLAEGKLELRSDDFYLGRLHLISEIFLPRLKEKELQIKFDPEEIPRDWKIEVDEVLFTNTVINNLISNAIKFSNPGSKIVVCMKKSDDFVSISVEDFGIGIPATLLENLFRADMPTTRDGTSGESGTGFGMPLVKKFVEAMNGTIEVTSRSINDNPEDHGTMATLKFPAK